jgi:hypothetical protein
MIEAFMDESGIHDGAHVCVIAGYWGSARKWKRFGSRWPQIIKAAGEPSVKEFHSTEFWYSDGRRKGVFAKWSDTKADKFIDDLVQCIVDAKLFPTSAVLVIDEWKKLNKDERKLLSGGYYDLATQAWIAHGASNRPYFLPFQFAVINPAIQCQPGLHVHYTFDLNKQFRHHALSLYKLLKEDPRLKCRHRLGSIDLEVSEKAVGLQAADLFAYQTYKFGKQRIASGVAPSIRDLPQTLRRLLANALPGDDDFPFFDREGLNLALSSLPKNMRSPGWGPVRPRVRHIL